LEYKPLSIPIVFVGTHFKAKKQYASSRVNQANALIEFLNQKYSKDMNIIVAGDFNGEPDESFYDILIRSGLNSAYRTLMNNVEPAFTTWKFKSREERREKEESRTIDYIFYRSEHLIPIAHLEFPSKTDIGPNALPSANYPSDHLALQSIFLIRI
jgi:endonuclease/exonuclease/phosphatase family metal-dependent hydrolase